MNEQHSGIEVSVINESWFEILAHRKSELQQQGKESDKNRMIAVFGGAVPSPKSSRYTQAFNVGVELAKQGAIVVNGGFGGVMEATAAGARSVGGITVGITCENLPAKVNEYIDVEWQVSRWDQRLLALVFLSDGYAVMPGSSGTLVKLSVVIETQIKGFIPARPIVCLGGHWSSVVKRIAGTTDMISFVRSPTELAKILTQK